MILFTTRLYTCSTISSLLCLKNQKSIVHFVNRLSFFSQKREDFCIFLVYLFKIKKNSKRYPGGDFSDIATNRIQAPYFDNIYIYISCLREFLQFELKSNSLVDKG